MHPYHINDPEFANALTESFLEIYSKNTAESSVSQVAPLSRQESKGHVSCMDTLTRGSVQYSPSNFPDAKPGCYKLYHVLIFHGEVIILCFPKCFCKCQWYYK